MSAKPNLIFGFAQQRYYFLRKYANICIKKSPLLLKNINSDWLADGCRVIVVILFA